MKTPRLLLAVLFATQLALLAPAARAQHGGGGPAPAPTKVAEINFAPEVKPDPAVKAFLAAFAESLFRRDAKTVLPFLAANYSIEGLPEGATQTPRELFAQAVTQIPSPAEFLVTSVKESNGTKVAKMELSFSSRVAKKVFTFDAEGKLLSTDLFKLSGPPPRETPKAAEPAKK